MLDLLRTSPEAFTVIFPGLLLALTIHEFAHAFVADRLGDPTPRFQGRVTLDPRAHLDPLGTLCMVLTGFGWGKPVQFDPFNLRNPVRDTALIALAGPASNLLILGLLAALYHTFGPDTPVLGVMLIRLGIINATLAIFNLVPIYPLDGSKIALSVLPKHLALEYDALMQRYGLVLLIIFLIPWGPEGSPVSNLILPIIKTIISLLFSVVLV